jgi:tRNA(Glu) U13 pseudouridine synthase TruD
VLAEMGLTRPAFAAGGSQAEGARRPLRVPVEGATVRAVGPDALELTFTLPAGSYATRVLAEVTRSEVELPSDG